MSSAFSTAAPAAPLSAAEVLAIARQVLHEEAAALHDVATALAATPDFTRCVQAILQLKGRVVVTGIGKSAHIAGKIVATLNSTGTPALVHARGRRHPRRPGHDSARRLRGGHQQKRRHPRNQGAGAAAAPQGRAAGGPGQQCRLLPGPAGRLHPARPGAARSLPQQPGADHQHHGGSGSG
jgi:hypothetical protein